MTENNRWGILFCPKGGLLNSMHRRWQRIEKALNAQHVQYDMVQSESMGSVERLVKMMINNGYKTIVIVGGDSALNDAVNCLMQVDKSVRDTISLGVIPNGMMNDFARFWEVEEGDIEHNVAALKRHRIRKIDLGCIRYTNRKGEKCRRYFLNCVNVGFIAAIMNLRRQTHHIFGSRALSFLFSFILLIFQRLDYAMHIHINSDDIKRKVMTVCVGNATGYGQTPNAVPYNGLLDVSVVYHPQMTQLFEGIYLFVKGKFLNHRSVHPYRTQEVEFLKADHALVGVDGRMISGSPVGPFKITVDQEVVNWILPS
ncbi:MAG: diacylglycerol kinase family protein [Prevotella sp.]|jgi:diacylglycerol kinase family enzyme|nr:diacylglycerol kinase family protein [Prevotella sp.]MDD7335937.1 diacylglycerol kinase family protein [Prevotella sp.]MDY4626704.1 diacylglycerol kinase family protein [Prevotella sp.]MDY5257874.1 diacylglycerol kinase family protein [Prevotella sp.]